MIAVNALKQLFFLLRNEIKKMYSGSIFGITWFIINPILYTFIYFILFEKIIQVKFVFKASNVSYFEYLIIGLILWNSFVNGVLRGSTSIVENAHILKKIFIPPEYFTIVYTLISFLQNFFLLCILLIILKVFKPIFLLIFVFISLSFYIFILGLSFILSSLTVYIRDIPQILNSIMNFLFYSIPIIYPYEHIPAFFKEIIFLNPLVYIFKPFHDVLFYKSIDIDTMLTNFIISISVFISGIFIFRKLKNGFYDVL